MTALEEQVLIVGAGPTGLTLACHLLQQEVPCRIVDRSDGPTTRSRAIGVSPRSLEIFDQIGVAAELVERGVRCHAASFYSQGERIGRMTFAAVPHLRRAFMLAVPQFETERALERRLHHLGGVVERGVSIDGLRSEPGQAGVAAVIDGHELLARWVVGADGAHSTVRKSAAIGFVGDTQEVFVNVDARVEGAPACGEGHYYLSREGMTVVVPLADGFCRVTASVQEQADEQLSLEQMRAILAGRLGSALAIGELRDAGWGIANVRVHARIAECFRAGRVVLAGDAAHLYGPMGAQGMNGGIQDAHNLAWRLGLVVREQAGERLIDTYDAERRAAARAVLHSVDRQTRLALLRGPAVVRIRDGLARVATRTGLIDKRLAPEVGQIDLSYRGLAGVESSRFSRRRSVLGRRVPDAPLETLVGSATLFEQLSRYPFTVLAAGVDCRHGVALTRLGQALAQRYGDAVRLQTVARPGERPLDPTGWVDRAAVLHRHIGVRGPVLCLLRADAHLAYVSPLHDRAGLFALLEGPYCLRGGEGLKLKSVSEGYLTPNLFVQRIANPLAMRLGLATTLEIRRRVSGATQAIPVNVLELDGEEYLVSVRGHSQWVRNLRASGSCQLRRRGRLRSYAAEEVPVDQRLPMIEAYRKRWGYQVGAFFKQLPDPADHPVFVLSRP